MARHAPRPRRRRTPTPVPTPTSTSCSRTSGPAQHGQRHAGHVHRREVAGDGAPPGRRHHDQTRAARSRAMTPVKRASRRPHPEAERSSPPSPRRRCATRSTLMPWRDRAVRTTLHLGGVARATPAGSPHRRDAPAEPGQGLEVHHDPLRPEQRERRHLLGARHRGRYAVDAEGLEPLRRAARAGSGRRASPAPGWARRRSRVRAATPVLCISRTSRVRAGSGPTLRSSSGAPASAAAACHTSGRDAERACRRRQTGE